MALKWELCAMGIGATVRMTAAGAGDSEWGGVGEVGEGWGQTM